MHFADSDRNIRGLYIVQVRTTHVSMLELDSGLVRIKPRDEDINDTAPRKQSSNVQELFSANMMTQELLCFRQSTPGCCSRRRISKSATDWSLQYYHSLNRRIGLSIRYVDQQPNAKRARINVLTSSN